MGRIQVLHPGRKACLTRYSQGCRYHAQASIRIGTLKDQIMTALRRQQRLGARSGSMPRHFLAACLRWPRPRPVMAATTERVVADRHTGLAISGFDPVPYFTDGVPRKGVADHEIAVRRRDLALPQRRQHGGLCGEIRKSILRNSAVTIRSRSRAGSQRPGIRSFGSFTQAALSVPVGRDARAVFRRSGCGARPGGRKMAGRGARSHSLIMRAGLRGRRPRRPRR